MGKENTINIKSLRTAPDFANCPETYCALGDKDKLYTVLLDSGAQSSILPWDIFQELGISSDKITKIRHCLNLQGSTGIHKNAIYGSLTINIFCMLKKKKENGKSFGRSKINFMVCSPEVKIEKIILGSPWLKSVNMDLQMSDSLGGDKAVCRLFSEGSSRRVSLQLKQDNFQMTSNTKINCQAQFKLASSV